MNEIHESTENGRGSGEKHQKKRRVQSGRQAEPSQEAGPKNRQGRTKSSGFRISAEQMESLRRGRGV